ncbi:DUF1349 domain-containing protein [Streptomyces sulphureus]|uniref:DUF1349 domain-containing protein n=1 Tax=Streptomyces sulphureus TaxID=47758 RepID=UPI000370406D|nr:DUF1349 domain-containing protein [Streptomyces sulphureus]
MSQQTLACFGYDDWAWLNPPREASVTADRVRVVADPGTDFPSGRGQRTTGHALLRPAPLRFGIRAVVTGAYREQYDQAGLLLWCGAHHWVKAGIEYVDGVEQLGAVVTRVSSDRSAVPLSRLRENSGPLTIALAREGPTVEIRFGLAGGEPRTLLRQAYFPPEPECRTGPMVASPTGAGFAAEFSGVRFRSP